MFLTKSGDKVEVSKDRDNMSPAAANRVLSTIYSGKFCVTSVQCPQPQLAAITTVVAAQLFLPTQLPSQCIVHLELEMKVREDFAIMENTVSRRDIGMP